MTISSTGSRIVLFSAILLCFHALPAEAAELKKETAAAFDRYVAVSEERINTELQNGPFLLVDEFPDQSRTKTYQQLRAGQILTKRISARQEGKSVKVPHGLVHHWMGLLFIPGSSLVQTLSVVQDYSDYAALYKPEIRKSTLLSRDGNNFKASFQLYKKSLVTVVINADFDITYEQLGTDRAASRSRATRLAEVENFGQPGEREMPTDDGHGYLWRLHTYWRFQEKDGGVYVQVEMIGLNRTVPLAIAWLVNPTIQNIARETVSGQLSATRTAVAERASNHPK